MYQKVIFKNLKNTNAMFNAGLCYAELNDNNNAIKSFKNVIAIDPNYAYAYYALGMAYENEKNYPESIANYEKFMTLTDDNETKAQVKNQIEYLKNKK